MISIGFLQMADPAIPLNTPSASESELFCAILVTPPSVGDGWAWYECIVTIGMFCLTEA